jgi:hypothetical protein
VVADARQEDGEVGRGPIRTVVSWHSHGSSLRHCAALPADGPPPDIITIVNNV